MFDENNTYVLSSHFSNIIFVVILRENVIKQINFLFLECSVIGFYVSRKQTKLIN